MIPAPGNPPIPSGRQLLRLAIFAFILPALLVATCTGCAIRHFDTHTAEAPVYENPVPYEEIGDKAWRVLGASEVTDSTHRARFLRVGEEVAECVGTREDMSTLRIFITPGLFVRSVKGWHPAYGRVSIDPEFKAIYLAEMIVAPRLPGTEPVLRKVTPAEARRTLRHEFVHFHSRLGHSAQPRQDTVLNLLIARCTR